MRLEKIITGSKLNKNLPSSLVCTVNAIVAGPGPMVTAVTVTEYL